MLLSKPFAGLEISRLTKAIVEDSYFREVTVGQWKNGDELIAAVTKNQDPRCDIVAYSAREDICGEYFQFGELRKVLPIVIRPRQLGFTKHEHPADVRQRALELGLKLCPDDLAAAYMLKCSFGTTYLFATRDIVPHHQVGIMFRVTTIDVTQRALGRWLGDHTVGPDTNICFTI